MDSKKPEKPAGNTPKDSRGTPTQDASCFEYKWQPSRTKDFEAWKESWMSWNWNVLNVAGNNVLRDTSEIWFRLGGRCVVHRVRASGAFSGRIRDINYSRTTFWGPCLNLVYQIAERLDQSLILIRASQFIWSSVVDSVGVGLRYMFGILYQSSKQLPCQRMRLMVHSQCCWLIAVWVGGVETMVLGAGPTSGKTDVAYLCLFFLKIDFKEK